MPAGAHRPVRPCRRGGGAVVVNSPASQSTTAAYAAGKPVPRADLSEKSLGSDSGMGTVYLGRLGDRATSHISLPQHSTAPSGAGRRNARSPH